MIKQDTYAPGGNGMRAFAELIFRLGTSTKTNDKLSALVSYFEEAADRDKVWVIALFSGRKPKRTVNSTQLAEWSREITGLPAWLFESRLRGICDRACPGTYCWRRQSPVAA